MCERGGGEAREREREGGQLTSLNWASALSQDTATVLGVVQLLLLKSIPSITSHMLDWLVCKLSTSIVSSIRLILKVTVSSQFGGGLLFLRRNN